MVHAGYGVDADSQSQRTTASQITRKSVGGVLGTYGTGTTAAAAAAAGWKTEGYEADETA